MEEENGDKRNPYRSCRDSDMYDRLEGSKHMSQPDYNINPQTLLENYVEKKVRFAGVIPDVQIDDVTNRTDVLRIIDEGKKQGRVHHRTTDKEHGTSFTLNVHNIKLTCKDELLLRICIHEIAAVCYIKDDNDFILPIKYGVPEKCNLVVLYVDNKMQAEEICALVDQCFQLVYADVAIQFININLNGAFGTSVPSSNTQSDSTTINNAPETALKPSYITTSDQNLTKNNTSSYSRSPKASKRTISVTTGSEISLTGDYSEVIQDYLKKLHKCLTRTELSQFARLLTTRHKGATTGEFCEGVFNLFGQERKHMMTGMGPFIEAKDYHVFEEFLSKNCMALPATHTPPHTHTLPANGTISSFHSTSQLCKDNCITTHSINSGDMDEFERIMDCISDQIDNMEHSVDGDSFAS
ncbi:cerebral cavernous malformations protein 2 homolog [Argonauta hians]